MKIVVINSNGPMGSSVVGGLVEKFGYLNLPIRNLGLNRYLLSRKEDDQNRLKEKFIQFFSYFDRKLKLGGVNIADRDTSPSYFVIDKKKIDKELSELKTKEFSDVLELYTSFRALYAKAIKYKTSNHIPGYHIEYTTYFDQYPTRELCEAYIHQFENVAFIHLHRDFVGWVESILSQYFAGPRKWRIILLHALYRRYVEYENSIKDCPGLHLNFESLFEDNIADLATEIAKEIDEPVPDLTWEDEEYDLYGRLRSFNAAFTLADVEGKYLSTSTRKFIRYCIKKKKITRLHDIVFYLLYIFDLIRLLVRKKA